MKNKEFFFDRLVHDYPEDPHTGFGGGFQKSSIAWSISFVLHKWRLGFIWRFR